MGVNAANTNCPVSDRPPNVTRLWRTESAATSPHIPEPRIPRSYHTFSNSFQEYITVTLRDKTSAIRSPLKLRWVESSGTETSPARNIIRTLQWFFIIEWLSWEHTLINLKIKIYSIWLNRVSRRQKSIFIQRQHPSVPAGRVRPALARR